jgi:transposase
MTYPKIYVNIPKDKGVHTKTAGKKGDRYVYKYTKYYRNKDGNPRNKAKIIGKYVTETGKMIPNTNYYEMFNATDDIHQIDVFRYGYTYIIKKSCKDIGLLDCLKNVFGKKAFEIIAVASYIICEGNAMDDIDVFQESNLIPGVRKLLTSESCNKLFESITEEQVSDFFENWINFTLKKDTVCYDVPSISSYSKTMTDLESGYTLYDDVLPQFNIGMFCCENSKLPLYYTRYNGSLTDKRNLSHVLANAKDVGIDNVKLTVGNAFMSENRFLSLNKVIRAFTISVPTHLDISMEMIKANKTKINRSDNKLKGTEIFCVEKSASLHGVRGKLMLFFDEISHIEFCQELSAHIEQLSMELLALKSYPVGELKRYEKYFTISKHNNDSGFDFILNSKKINQMKRDNGFFLIFSTDLSQTPEDILYYYRAKYEDTKLFTQFKFYMEGRHICTHNEDTTDGKIFITFIALTIRAYMLDKLNNYLSENYSSLKLAINKLKNIIVINNNGKKRFSKALTNEQKEILSSFNAVDDIVASLDTSKG